jgi:hypothetical protein
MKSMVLWLSILATASAWTAERATVGLVSKVVYDVTRKEIDTDWQKAVRGATLASGDRVRTGDRSLAVIKFKDNSLVRVRERSELTVTGSVNGRTFSKEVRIDKGVVGFTIQKQQAEEEFRFTSPTSVASIRGTGGSFTHAAADTLIVTEGSILFTNTFSGRSVTVGEGFTGIAGSDGSIVTRPSTPDERRSALEASRAGDRENQLEFELQGPQGDRKTLRIDYR